MSYPRHRVIVRAVIGGVTGHVQHLIHGMRVWVRAHSNRFKPIKLSTDVVGVGSGGMNAERCDVVIV